MSWSLYRWVWQLESPVFVGIPPAGSLNRCRPYVPARNIWGALTFETSQAAANAKEFPDYQGQGSKLRKCLRFTYLFPAARVNSTWLAWLPAYERNRGLTWRREDCTSAQNSDTAVSDRQFRRWIIDARPGTAIDADSDTAAEATLRETEYLMTRWRLGSPFGGEPAALVGYVFLDNSNSSADSVSVDDLKTVRTLFIGGDTRYGLGRLRRIEFESSDRVFRAQTLLDESEPRVITSHLLAHGHSAQDFLGAKETLVGWNRTLNNPLVNIGDLQWVPGSRANEDVTWKIGPEGFWSAI